MASKAISSTTKWKALEIFIPRVGERVHSEESKQSEQMSLLAQDRSVK